MARITTSRTSGIRPVPWARARLRVLLARVSLAHDYGAVGAALFDIVNVQNWTRRRISGPFKHVCFRTGSERSCSPKPSDRRALSTLCGTARRGARPVRKNRGREKKRSGFCITVRLAPSACR